MIEFAADRACLEKALEMVTRAERQGFDGAVAVLCLAAAGEAVTDCRAAFQGQVILVASGTYYGRAADRTLPHYSFKGGRFEDRLYDDVVKGRRGESDD